MIETVREVAMCAGNFGMVGGQVIDLDSEGRQISEEDCVSCMQAKQEHFSLRQFAVVRDCLVLPVMSCWL